MVVARLRSLRLCLTNIKPTMPCKHTVPIIEVNPLYNGSTANNLDGGDMEKKPRVRIPALVREKREPLAVGQVMPIGKRMYRVHKLDGGFVTMMSVDKPYTQIHMTRGFLEPNE